MVYVFIFVLGCIVGSFLNVLIDRLPQAENPFVGRSHCDHCKKTLRVVDLIPLLSFVMLKGKSSCCHKPLSWRMPLVELTTGIIFVYTWLYSLQLSTVYYELRTLFLLIIFCSFLVIFFVDFKHHIIPDEMIISSIFGVLLYTFSSSFSYVLIYENFLSGAGAAMFLLLIFLFTKGKGMGFGDVKLALALGLFLGPEKAVVGMYLAFLTGAIVSLILILIGRKKLKHKIAFGPFLIVGTIISFFYGGILSTWYFSFF